MDAHDIVTRPSEMPLEAVEFELALNSQDIAESGFETALQRAAERADGAILFHMPALKQRDCQRVAAVSLGAGSETHTVLVLLGRDGGSVRIENATDSDSPFAGIALSYRGLLDLFGPADTVNG